MEKIVKEHIESVNFFKKAENFYFKVLPEKTFRRFLQKPLHLPKRVISHINLSLCGEKCEDYTLAEYFGDGELYVDGEKIFYYPHLEIRMISGKTYTKYFKTEDEVYSYISFNLNGINFITI